MRSPSRDRGPFSLLTLVRSAEARRVLYFGATLSAFACSFPERTFIPADEFDRMKNAGGTSGAGGSAASGGSGATGAVGGESGSGGMTSGGTAGAGAVGGEGGTAGTTGVGAAGNGGAAGDGGTGATTSGGTGGSAGNTTGGTAGATGGMGGTGGSAPTNGLIISEYVEGGGNTKAVELYNSSSSDIDIGDCTLVRHVNVTIAGATSMDNITVAPSGTMLPAGSTWTICYTGSGNLALATGKCKITSGSLQHNGDDAYSLSCGGVVEDTFGEDPAQTLTSSHWGETTGVSSADQTLRRKCTVTQGDTSLLDTFNPATEYDTYPKDDVSDLGTHCGSAD